jgi:hypothetical protein
VGMSTPFAPAPASGGIAAPTETHVVASFASRGDSNKSRMFSR